MTLTITFNTSVIDNLAGIKQSEVSHLMGDALRKHSPMVIREWSSRITATPGPHLTLSGSPRRPYRNALRFKLWKWSSRTGVSAIFGPSGREVPHAHLPEYGTKNRSRLPYLPGSGKRGGHGVRGKYEMVNFRGSKRNGKPPFPAGHPILRTGAVSPHRWKEQAADAISERYAYDVLTTFRDSFTEFLSARLVGPSK